MKTIPSSGFGNEAAGIKQLPAQGREEELWTTKPINK